MEGPWDWVGILPTRPKTRWFGHLHWLASKRLDILRCGGRENRRERKQPYFNPSAKLFQSELSKKQTWSAPPLLKTFKAPLDLWIIIMWPQSTSLVGPFLQSCIPQLCQNSLCSLISLSWHKESSCLGLPWLLSLVWLTPPHPSCLRSGIASPGLPPQIPPPPSYLERYYSLYQGLESFL